MSSQFVAGDVWQHRTTGQLVAILNTVQLASTQQVIAVDVTAADQHRAGGIVTLGQWDMLVDWVHGYDHQWNF